MGKPERTTEVWNVRQSTDGEAWLVWTASGSIRVWIEDESDARLMASAPDMEDALEALLLDHCYPSICNRPAHKQAYAALAKARGETLEAGS